MTVFIAHAPKDAPAAEALEKFLERRGLFVERETGERGFRFAQPRDTVVVLWSRDTVFWQQRLQIEKRALEAWADEHLVLVKLDQHVAPVGLRDITAVDAVFEPQREIAWSAIAKTAQDQQVGRPQNAPKRAPPSQPDSPPAPDARSKRMEPQQADEEEPSVGYAVAALLAIPAGAFLSLAVGLRDPAWPIIGSGLVVGLVWWLAKRPHLLDQVLRREKTVASAPPPASEHADADRREAETGGAGPTPGAAFVSYAHADAASVLPVVDQMAATGKSVWIDRDGIQAGDGWAGEIVRAVKAAGAVVVMCSAKAFESDHVRREIYLADRYKKPMLPVFLEEATPPEDFEYFFAGVQQLRLFEAPEAERAAALERAWPKG